MIFYKRETKMKNYITYEVKTFPNGHKEWCLNGIRHREDGPAIEYSDGTKEWYLNGEFHREDGPAIEYPDGQKEWCLNGNYHREDGPAIEYADGTKEWRLNGEELTEDQFIARTSNVNACDDKIVEIDGVKYKLTPA